MNTAFGVHFLTFLVEFSLLLNTQDNGTVLVILVSFLDSPNVTSFSTFEELTFAAVGWNYLGDDTHPSLREYLAITDTGCSS